MHDVDLDRRVAPKANMIRLDRGPIAKGAGIARTKKPLVFCHIPDGRPAMGARLMSASGPKGTLLPFSPIAY